MKHSKCPVLSAKESTSEYNNFEARYFKVKKYKCPSYQPDGNKKNKYVRKTDVKKSWS